MPSGHLLLDPTIHFFRLPSNSKQVFKLLCCCCCCCWHPWTGGWIYSYTNGKRVRRIGVGGDNICMANTAALDSCQEGTLEKYLSQSGRNLLAFTSTESNWTGNIWRWWFCDSEFHLQTIWSICRKVENKGNWGTAGATPLQVCCRHICPKLYIAQIFTSRYLSNTTITLLLNKIICTLCIAQGQNIYSTYNVV